MTEQFTEHLKRLVREKRVEAMLLSRDQRKERYREIASMQSMDIFRVIGFEMKSANTGRFTDYYYHDAILRFALRTLRERMRNQ